MINLLIDLLTVRISYEPVPVDLLYTLALVSIKPTHVHIVSSYL